jgi:hypothetical protein
MPAGRVLDARMWWVNATRGRTCSNRADINAIRSDLPLVPASSGLSPSLHLAAWQAHRLALNAEMPWGLRVESEGITGPKVSH